MIITLFINAKSVLHVRSFSRGHCGTQSPELKRQTLFLPLLSIKDPGKMSLKVYYYCYRAGSMSPCGIFQTLTAPFNNILHFLLLHTSRIRRCFSLSITCYWFVNVCTLLQGFKVSEIFFFFSLFATSWTPHSSCRLVIIPTGST